MIKEEKVVVLPPNKELEAVYEFSKTPNIYNHLIFLDFNTEGSCILGNSNITGTFWEGSVIFCRTVEDLKCFKYTSYYIYLSAADGKFLTNDTIALAEESGVLSILSTREGKILKPINNFRHQGRIPQIAVWDNSSNVLSCSGRGLAIWDVDKPERIPAFTFDNIHLADINSVDTFKLDTNLFVSAAADKNSCLWDKRLEVPTVLYVNEFAPLTRIAVNQADTNYCAIGTLAGDIYLVDKREPKNFVAVHHAFDSSINSLIFNNSHHIGVVGSTNEVLVLNTNNGNFEEVYRNKTHVGIVKDLKWHKNSLFSCGFDKQIIEHTI